MVLTSEERTRLIERLDQVSDFGGVVRVAELAKVTPRVIHKAQSGGNVRVETMRAVTSALEQVEVERNRAVLKLKRALAA